MADIYPQTPPDENVYKFPKNLPHYPDGTRLIVKAGGNKRPALFYSPMPDFYHFRDPESHVMIHDVTEWELFVPKTRPEIEAHDGKPIEPKYPQVFLYVCGRNHDRGSRQAVMENVAAAIKKAGLPDRVYKDFCAEVEKGGYKYMVQTVRRWFSTD